MFQVTRGHFGGIAGTLGAIQLGPNPLFHRQSSGACLSQPDAVFGNGSLALGSEGEGHGHTGDKGDIADLILRRLATL